MEEERDGNIKAAGGWPADDAIAKAVAAQDNRAQRAWWLGQMRGNLPLLGRCRDIKDIKDMFGGLPGVVAGAGPGLEKNAHLLAGREREYPIFCCDRAFPMLREAGVAPQFAVVADASERVAGFFDGCDVRRTVLLAPAYAHRGVFELPWRTRVAFNVTDADPTYVNAARNIMLMIDRELSELPGALIVGNVAFLAAKLAGCAPITFIGSDLSMPAPAAGEAVYEGTGPEGRKVYSTAGYLAGLEWLMKFVKVDKDIKCGKLRVFNSTEGGILYGGEIRGLPLADFLGEFPGAKKSLDTVIRKRVGSRS